MVNAAVTIGRTYVVGERKRLSTVSLNKIKVYGIAAGVERILLPYILSAVITVKRVEFIKSGRIGNVNSKLTVLPLVEIEGNGVSPLGKRYEERSVNGDNIIIRNTVISTLGKPA